MDIKEILAHVDHTELSPGAVWEDIRALCDDGIRYGTASVCIPQSYVGAAAEYTAGRIPVCTVVGFPCGYSGVGVKVYETERAISDGASEIDMVINIGALRDGRDGDVLREIADVRRASEGYILKVIIETCLLSENEKIRACRIVSESGADYIKTSTGFSTGGATPDDIILLKQHVAPHVKIKAAGGIKTVSDAENFLSLGAERLGTSRIVRIVRESGLL